MIKKVFCCSIVALLVICGILAYNTPTKTGAYNALYDNGNVWIYENEITGQQYLVYKNGQGGTNSIRLDALQTYDFIPKK